MASSSVILLLALIAVHQINAAYVGDSGVAGVGTSQSSGDVSSINTQALTVTDATALSSSIAGGAGLGGVPGPKCYKKIVNCCFKYGSCGAKEKLTPVSTRCDFKKCGKVCRTSCQFVAARIPKRTCSFQKVSRGPLCGEFLSYGPYKKPVVTPKCVDQFALQGSCEQAYDVVHRQKCETVCVPTCKVERAECTKTDVFNFAKFCPTLSCSSEKIDGSTSAPKQFVGGDRRLVREIPGPKEIITSAASAASSVSSGSASNFGASGSSGSTISSDLGSSGSGSSGAAFSSGAAY